MRAAATQQVLGKSFGPRRLTHRHGRIPRVSHSPAHNVAAKLSERHSPKAAVVGGGEHGLIAALHLQKLGYKTTVFESEDRLVPIFNSVQLGQVKYDYLSIGLMPSGHFQGSGTTPVLAEFAATYNQCVEPFPAALAQNFLSLDSVTGVLQIPSFWASKLGKPAFRRQPDGLVCHSYMPL